MGGFFFSKRKKLVISAATSFATNNISRSNVYTAFRVNNKAEKNYQCKISIQ